MIPLPEVLPEPKPRDGDAQTWQNRLDASREDGPGSKHWKFEKLAERCDDRTECPY